MQVTFNPAYILLFLWQIRCVVAFIQRNVSPVQRSNKKLAYWRTFSNIINRNEVPQEILPVPFTGTGCVLLARPNERDHFLMKGAILITEHGSRGSVGVLVDKSTPYSVKEASPGLGDVFEKNMMYIGGEKGNDNLALMIHKHKLGGLTKYLGYGLYVGGIKQAEVALQSGEYNPFDFKFVFNCISWAPGCLENEIAQGRWDICAIPPDIILNQDSRKYPPLWSSASASLQEFYKNHAISS